MNERSSDPDLHAALDNFEGLVRGSESHPFLVKDSDVDAARDVLVKFFSEEQTRWIPVSERLPEFKEGSDQVVVIAARDSSPTTFPLWYSRNPYAKTEKGRAPKWKHGWGHEAATPTHWMPLPEAP